jgi:hypothetical protein
MRPNATLTVVAGLLAFTTGGAAAQDVRQATQRAMALTRPALDGTVLAGVQLTFSEHAVVALFGEPQARAVSPYGGEVLRYDVAAGARLDVHVAGGTVNALGVIAPGRPESASSPQTVRGIRLGMPVARVLERYGSRDDGRLWYADEGIAFNVEGPALTVTSILVFPRGMPPP